MQKLVTALIALTVLAPVALQAAEAKGKVVRFDAATKMLVLDTGASCVLAANVPADGIAQGRDVIITYEAAGGQNTCSRVAAAQ